MTTARVRGRLCAGVAAAAVLAGGGPALAQEDLQAMRKRLETVSGELQQLKERIAQHEADNARRRVAAAAAVEAGDKPRSWKIPGTNTSMRIGGRIYAHLTWDWAGVTTDPANRTRGANVAAVAPEGSMIDNQFNGGHWQFTARYTRLWFQTSTPTDWGEFGTYIEGDFSPSQGELFRLRYAYGTLGPFLAGQADSLFRAGFIEGDPMDINGPPGTPGSRTPQVRYTHNLGGGLSVAASLENPVDSIRGGSPSGQRWPELGVALDYRMPSARVYVAGLFKQIEHDTGTGNNSDKAFGWGVLVAGEYQITPKFWVAGVGYVGEGTGNSGGGIAQAGFTDAIFVAANHIEPLFYYGGFGAAEYRLTDTIRIRGLFGFALQDVEKAVARNAIPGGTSHYVWGAEGNLEWYPVPGVRFGVGYHHSFNSRYNGPNAQVSRVILRGRFDF
jgi:hypothetical protein